MTGVSMTTWKSGYQNVENLRTLLQQETVGVIIHPWGWIRNAIRRYYTSPRNPNPDLNPTLPYQVTLTL